MTLFATELENWSYCECSFGTGRVEILTDTLMS
jgi:hypothetical protein